MMRIRYETVKLEKKTCPATTYTTSAMDERWGVPHLQHVWHHDIEGGVTVYYWCVGCEPGA